MSNLDLGIAPVQIDLFLESYLGKRWHLRPLVHQTGWMLAAKYTLDTYVGSYEEIVVSACSDQGLPYSRFQTDIIEALESSFPRECHFDPPPELMDRADALFWDFLGRCDLEALQALEQAERENEHAIARLQFRADRIIPKAEAVIAANRRRLRLEVTDPSMRETVLQRNMALENGIRRSQEWLVKKIAKLHLQLETFTQDTFNSLSIMGDMEVLWIAHWRTRTDRRMFDLKLPLQEDARHNPGIDVNSDTAERAAQVMNRDIAKQGKRALAAKKPLRKDNTRTQPVAKREPGTAARTSIPNGLPLVGMSDKHPDFIPVSRAAKIYATGVEDTAKNTALSPEEIKRRREVWRARRAALKEKR